MDNKKSAKHSVKFVCSIDPEAKSVYLVGDFNQWDPTDKLMEKKKDGKFTASVKLAPGRYEYKFLVNGLWNEDPNAKEQVVNSFGTKNSVLIVE